MLEDIPGTEHQMGWQHITLIQRLNDLNNTFEKRWIGNNRPVRWPARSQDLTPTDFLRRYLETVVCETQLTKRLFSV